MEGGKFKFDILSYVTRDAIDARHNDCKENVKFLFNGIDKYGSKNITHAGSV